VNDLPDPNYATLKYFLGHLQRISQNEAVNQMSISNLAIVFGPTLFGYNPGPAPGPQGGQGGPVVNGGGGGGGILDTGHQNRAVETILEHYTDIFVEES